MWGSMMTHMGSHGWGHMLFGSLMMVLFWGAIIAFIIALVRKPNKRHSNDIYPQNLTALELLKKHYARGEIDKSEYEERRRDIES